MKYYLCVLALSLTVLPAVYSAPGHAQDHGGTAEQQRACRADVIRYCRGIRDDFAIADCLRAHSERLHPACRRVIEGR